MAHKWGLLLTNWDDPPSWVNPPAGLDFSLWWKYLQHHRVYIVATTPQHLSPYRNDQKRLNFQRKSVSLFVDISPQRENQESSRTFWHGTRSGEMMGFVVARWWFQIFCICTLLSTNIFQRGWNHQLGGFLPSVWGKSAFFPARWRNFITAWQTCRDLFKKLGWCDCRKGYKSADATRLVDGRNQTKQQNIFVFFCPVYLAFFGGQVLEAGQNAINKKVWKESIKLRVQKCAEECTFASKIKQNMWAVIKIWVLAWLFHRRNWTTTVDGSEIPNNHLVCKKTLVNSG